MNHPIPPMTPFGYYLTKDNFEVCGCQSKSLPDLDLISAGAGQRFHPEAFAGIWQITVDDALRLFQRNYDLYLEHRMAFFNTRYLDLDAARIMKQDFFAGRNDVHILGVGIAREARYSFHEMPEFDEIPPFGDSGDFLGFDLYGFYCIDRKNPDFKALTSSMECPFRHCDMDNKVPESIGIKLNSYGFCPDNISAWLLSDHVREQELGEPVLYYPFGIIRYE